MAKSKYIKVTDEKGKSSVVLGTNEAFYRSQKYKVSEPTAEEIQAYFPSDQTQQAPVPSTNTINDELLDEKQAHAETANKLKLEQNSHTLTKQSLDSVNSELQNEKQAHAESKQTLEIEISKLQSEIEKLKKKA